MGWGDFGSNGSVHWRLTYNDATGSVAHLGYDDLKKHPDKPGNDPRPGIGQGKAGPGKLRVTARFQNASDARDAVVGTLSSLHQNPDQARVAIAQALSSLQAQNPIVKTDAILDIPIFGFRPKAPDPTKRSEWEVSVDW